MQCWRKGGSRSENLLLPCCTTNGSNPGKGKEEGSELHTRSNELLAAQLSTAQSSIPWFSTFLCLSYYGLNVLIQTLKKHIQNRILHGAGDRFQICSPDLQSVRWYCGVWCLTLKNWLPARGWSTGLGSSCSPSSVALRCLRRISLSFVTSRKRRGEVWCRVKHITTGSGPFENFIEKYAIDSHRPHSLVKWAMDSHENCQHSSSNWEEHLWSLKCHSSILKAKHRVWGISVWHRSAIGSFQFPVVSISWSIMKKNKISWIFKWQKSKVCLVQPRCWKKETKAVARMPESETLQLRMCETRSFWYTWQAN